MTPLNIEVTVRVRPWFIVLAQIVRWLAPIIRRWPWLTNRTVDVLEWLSPHAVSASIKA